MRHQKDTITILEVLGLDVGYGRKAVLQNVGFNLEAGRFLSLLGPNGAGKTTLLRTMARLIPAMAGSIKIAGHDFGSIAQADLARLQAVVLTDRLNPGMLTAYEVVALGRHPHTGFFGKLCADDHQAIERAIEMVGAGDLTDRYFERLSDGEKQKIVLARALAQEPRLILLDEPTVHLDLKHRLEVMSILRNLCREVKVAVVASLHDIDIATRVSDQVALISGGGLAAFGPPEVILDDRSVSQLYNLNGAYYDSRLGVIELKSGKHRGPVFVLPGGGSASAVLKLLHKRDYAIMCGVAHVGDIDTHIAKALGAELVTAPPFGQASPDCLQRCREMMERAEAVIDSGFQVGPANRENAYLLAEAAQMAKPIFSLRPPEVEELAGHPLGSDAVRCADEMELASRLSAYFHRSAARQ
jgi:iron complex transport system ATP-binding protein